AFPGLGWKAFRFTKTSSGIRKGSNDTSKIIRPLSAISPAVTSGPSVTILCLYLTGHEPILPTSLKTVRAHFVLKQALFQHSIFLFLRDLAPGTIINPM